MAKTKWKLDPAHSQIEFKARHLMITTVTGYFKRFDLYVETEENDFTKADTIIFTADINSIDTNNAQRDTHLKSEDFFAAEKYGELKFTGRHFEKVGAHYRLEGDLSIRGITRPVVVTVEYGGLVKDPYGQIKAGFSVEGKLRRKDFNLSWDAVTEAGQVVVSNEIRFHGEIQLIRQEETRKPEMLEEMAEEKI